MIALSDQHKIQYYQSKDLFNWTLKSEFGPSGSTSGVWECPDLFMLRVSNEKNLSKWIHIVSINPGAPQGGSASQYFIGDFNGTHFIMENNSETPLWIDYGFDFYAVQSFENDPIYKESNQEARTAIAWMSNWKYAGNIPTDVWRGAQSFPREFFLKKRKDGKVRLYSRLPKISLDILKEKTHIFSKTKDEVQLNKEIKGKISQGLLLYIKAVFWVEGASGKLELKVRKSMINSQETVVSYNLSDKCVTVDRSNSGLSNFSTEFAGANIYHIEDLEEKNLITFEILVDVSSVEVIVNRGEVSFTNLIFPDSESQGVTIEGFTDKIYLEWMEISELKKTMNN